MPIDRRAFLEMTAAGAAYLATRPLAAAAAETTTGGHFVLQEASASDLAARLAKGELTSHQLTQAYLERIAALDHSGPSINSIIELNPDALAIAEALDREAKEKGRRGPLHGLPVLIKDNIDTADRMHTTAGSLALSENIARRDATVAARLRSAGCVILGKTNLSEWANFRSTHSTSGWSGRGGQTRNPYALDRNPCGSSSGTGAALSASLAALGIGTETDGSIVCPSSGNGLVGLKPTVGLVSRAGIIPISASQDTAGPMCRTVRDVAMLLSVLTGEDPRDAATVRSKGKTDADYTTFLDAQGLRGARVGIARQYFGFSDQVDALMHEAIDVMKGLGATFVDPADMDSSGKYDEAESLVLSYEFKDGVNAYLNECIPAVAARNLAGLIRFNETHRDREMPWFGQELFEKAEKRGSLTTPEYVEALKKCHQLSRQEGLDALLAKHKLDVVIAPTGGPVWPTDLLNGDHFTGGYSTASAVSGYPHITVPAGRVGGLPVGISFFAGAWSEGKLLRYAYAFEQATRHRVAPKYLSTVQL